MSSIHEGLSHWRKRLGDFGFLGKKRRWTQQDNVQRELKKTHTPTNKERERERNITHVIGIGIPMIPLLHLFRTLVILPKLFQHLEYFFGNLHLLESQCCVIDHTLRLSQIHLETIPFALVARVVIAMTTGFEEGIVKILSIAKDLEGHAHVFVWRRDIIGMIWTRSLGIIVWKPIVVGGYFGMMLWKRDVETICLLVEFVVFVIVIGGGHDGVVETCGCRDDDGDGKGKGRLGECHGSSGGGCNDYLQYLLS
jgi:hypothetical protein